jgi:flagellar protein FliS
MMEKGYDAYRTTNIGTADQGKLILILYDIAINHCQESLAFFGDTQQIAERTRHLKKVQDAISELMGALKMDAGEIAHNLYRLYEYMLRRLVNANLRHEPGYIKEILEHLTSLREAWNEAIQKLKTEAAQQRCGEQQKDFALIG